MATLRFPSIANVAERLRSLNTEFARLNDLNVYLLVYPDGRWTVQPGYSHSRNVFYGSAWVPGDGKRFRSISRARSLLRQARREYALASAGGAVSS